MSDDHSPAFMALIFVGGLIFGLGLAISQMVRMEVVLDFLQFEDFGLAFVMGGAAVVVGITVFVATATLDRAPLTGDVYGRRVRELDSNVLAGGLIFGVGWGLSGMCPGAAYASLGVGNLPILWGLVGMFIGAYAQGFFRSYRASSGAAPAAGD